VFEFLLSEWHITPDYIVNNWTEELLNLMLEKLVDRKKKEINAIKGRDNAVSVETLAAQSRGMIKVIN